MKKLLTIAIIAIFAANTANAQEYDYDIDELREVWQRTITVPASEDPIIEKLFLAWGKEFNSRFADAFLEYKKTGKAKDYKIDFAPKNGFLQVDGTYSFVAEENGNYLKGDVVTKINLLQAAYWNLPNGNKLFGVSVEIDGEIFANCTVMFYEYNASKGTLKPRADVVNRIYDKMGISNPPEGEEEEIFVKLPKAGRDLKYKDYSTDVEKVIKWNGNGF